MVRITLRRPSADSDADFIRFVNAQPQIESAYSISGDADYVLDVRCRDLAEFGTFVHECLLSHPLIGQVRSDVVLRTVKDRAALDLRPDRR